MEQLQDEELKRQSLLLESLAHNEAFLLWRKEIVEPMLTKLEFLIADSDTLSEPVLRANVKLRYLLQDALYTMFDRVKVVNEQEREELNK